MIPMIVMLFVMAALAFVTVFDHDIVTALFATARQNKAVAGHDDVFATFVFATFGRLQCDRQQQRKSGQHERSEQNTGAHLFVLDS